MELMPPEYSDRITKVTSGEMLVLPLVINGCKVNFVMAIDNKIEMN